MALTASTDRKANERWLTKLQVSLETGDLSSVAESLSSGLTHLQVTRIRERKLILRAPIDARKHVAELFRVATASFESKERSAFDRYLNFSLAVDVARRQSLEKALVLLRQMPQCSKAELLEVGDAVFDWYAAKLMKGVDVFSVAASVAERERRLHDVNGALVDVASAVARAINERSRIAVAEIDLRLSREQRRRARMLMRSAVKFASEVNSHEFFFDSVSFGDFAVDDWVESPLSTFRFQFSDERRYLLRTLAIRRGLVLNFAQRKGPRYLREKLREFQPIVFDQAVHYYLHEAGASPFSTADLARAQMVGEASLALISADDDLLLAGSRFDSKVVGHYLISMAMRWFASLARVVRVDTRGTHRTSGSPPVPLTLIADCIKDGTDGKWVTTALENLTSELPAKNHCMLLDRPFVRDGLHIARPLFGGELGTWNTVVREVMIQGGALGKDVGAIWEHFYADSFSDSDWEIVGRGVKLRKSGQILTDVDLLLLREDLLLVVQIKALIGSGNTVYDHWKNRQTIEFGCAQAGVAAEFYEADSKALVSLCGKHAAAGIKHIQPIVLTNLDHLDGWSFNDVPVIGEVTRKAICQGSKVEYFDFKTGEVQHTHHFVRREDLTTEVILQMLRQPVEIHIAAEGLEIKHDVHRVGSVTFLMPVFVVRKDLNEPPAHEPVFQTPGRRSSA
jgi:hypothetical protein